jgi:hypothetical protein
MKAKELFAVSLVLVGFVITTHSIDETLFTNKLNNGYMETRTKELVSTVTYSEDEGSDWWSSPEDVEIEEPTWVEETETEYTTTPCFYVEGYGCFTGKGN